MEEQYKDYFYEKTYRDIIEKFIFIKTVEKVYGDEIIELKYGIKPAKIRSLYGAIPSEQRKKIQDEVKGALENGEISIDDLAKRCINERGHRDKIRSINQRNKKGGQTR